MSTKETQTMKPKIVHNKDLGNGKQSKLEKLSAYMHKIKDENFTGYIKVNFSQGSVGRIEKFEEILKK